MDFRADFEITLDSALASLIVLRSDAQVALNQRDSDNAEWDGAFQVWQDLDRAVRELELTRSMIRNGAI